MLHFEYYKSQTEMNVNNSYSGAGRRVVLIVPKNGYRLSARINIIAAGEMCSNDVLAFLQTPVSINIMTGFTQCCGVTLAVATHVASCSPSITQRPPLFTRDPGIDPFIKNNRS